MTTEPGYPEDWQEQGWCCRACAVAAWTVMTPVPVKLTGEQARDPGRLRP